MWSLNRFCSQWRHGSVELRVVEKREAFVGVVLLGS
jgi:hypothetical protein